MKHVKYTLIFCVTNHIENRHSFTVGTTLVDFLDMVFYSSQNIPFFSYQSYDVTIVKTLKNHSREET